MMVKKFNDFINEGFLSKTINRAKSGGARIEDKLPPNNLKDLKPIDIGLPFLIADDVLWINKTKFFSLNDETYSLIDKIEKTGWRLPTVDDVKLLQKHQSVKHTADHRDIILYNSNNTDDKVWFIFTSHDFFIHDEDQTYDDVRGIGRVMFSMYYVGHNFMKICACADTEFCTFRLIKDKK
ncbi:MAG: hypothetical protein NC548_21365 [Lachnospiraceae bacterium]|nr:hypothetical protein [Lachnospiraceae bacterium]